MLEQLMMLFGGGDPQQQRLEGMGFNPSQIQALQQGALAGTQPQTGGGGITNDQLVAAMLMQGMMQQNQQYMASPDEQTRAFGLAQSGVLPFANALAQMPLIKQQQEIAQRQAMMQQLEALAKMRESGARTGKLEAETAEIPRKGKRADKRLELDATKSALDAKFKEAELMLKEMGLYNEQTRMNLEQIRIAIDQGRLENEQNRLRLEIEKLEMEDPRVAQLIAAGRLLPEDERDEVYKSLRSILEQKLGVRLTDDRSFWEKIMPSSLGGRQSPVGKPFQSPAIEVSSPTNPETMSEEDKLILELMGQ